FVADLARESATLVDSSWGCLKALEQAEQLAHDLSQARLHSLDQSAAPAKEERERLLAKLVEIRQAKEREAVESAHVADLEGRITELFDGSDFEKLKADWTV